MDATFIIKIKFLQNTSWQGTIQRLDTGAKRCFRSEGEMLMLMQEAIKSIPGAECHCDYRTWDDCKEGDDHEKKLKELKTIYADKNV